MFVRCAAMSLVQNDMKRMLLAELDLRLQATQGLLEAAAHHATEHP